jgi:hypothetical protein
MPMSTKCQKKKTPIHVTQHDRLCMIFTIVLQWSIFHCVKRMILTTIFFWVATYPISEQIHFSIVLEVAEQNISIIWYHRDT